VTQSYGSKTVFSKDRRAAEISLQFLASLGSPQTRHFYMTGVVVKTNCRKTNYENKIIFS
jgi:hypothetical protein